MDHCNFEPPRAPIGLSSVCDCACFALEGGAVPALSRPLSFYLELTHDCNNNCPTCGNTFTIRGQRASGDRPPLSAAGWQQVIESLSPHAHRLQLTGGEPTLHPEFPEIVQHLATTGIPFTLFTNGRWHDPDKLLDLLAAAPNFEGLLISLHGSSAASHQAFTETPGSFADTIRGIQAAVAHSISVALSCVITAHNWTRIDQMVMLSDRLGAQGVVFNRYLGDSMPGIEPTPFRLHTAIERVEALRAIGVPVKLGNCVPACFMPTTQPGCLAGLAFLTIDPWGRARPCNHVPDIVGCVTEQSVERIWHSAAMEAWRQSRTAACDGCALTDTCRGGCKALTTAEGPGHDPLMCAPLPAALQSEPVDAILDGGARPVARFSLHPEAFGPVLLRGSQIFVATWGDEPLFGLLDGQSTLGEIEAHFGQRGIDLVASLYYNGMIELL